MGAFEVDAAFPLLGNWGNVEFQQSLRNMWDFEKSSDFLGKLYFWG